MAFETERSKMRSRMLGDAWAGSQALAGRVRELAGRAAPWGEVVKGWLLRQPLFRFVTASLKRRIIASNLLGLLILLGGYLYLNQYKAWLVDAKVDSLTAQGDIIAQAIAANAALVGERIVLDPDELPERETSLNPFRGNDFNQLQFSLGPEKVEPVLRRLIQPDIRARVFDRDGKLIVDSKAFLSRASFNPPAASKAAEESSKPRTKNFWTRLTEYLYTSDLPVLKELEQANGNYYPPVRSAMGGAGAPMLLLNEDGEQIVSYAAPIKRAQRVQGVLLLSTEPGEIEKVLIKERNAIFKVALLALAATLLAAMLLHYSVAGPLRRLSAAAEHVSRNINARHDLPDYSGRKDEVGRLSHSFNAMTAALYRRIEASEKFAADVAHELKNPLTAARSTAELLSYAKTEEQRDQLVQTIQMELKRLNKLITDVSNASRLDAELALNEYEPFDVTVVLTGVTDAFRDIVSDDGRKVVLEVEPSKAGFVIKGIESRFGQVATNLIDNALSFSPEDGTVTVRLRRTRDHVVFSVEDEGPGIEPDKLETIFDRFYTYRPTANASRGNNSGLGLSISREIVYAHSGRIWAENRYRSGEGPGAKPLGARFTVELPVDPHHVPRSRHAAKLTRRG